VASIAAPPPTVADELPTLAGIDVAAALARVNGKRALLWRLIGDFRQRQRDADQRIQTALARGDFTAARELAHAIKGAAATLGMQRVAAAAGALEQAVLQARADNAALTELKAALAEIDGVALPQTAEASSTPSAGGRPADALQRLATALAGNSLSARQDYAQLRAALDPQWHAELAAIGECIDALDFVAAATRLTQLAPRITSERSSC
jgi:hypothetical protein